MLFRLRLFYVAILNYVTVCLQGSGHHPVLFIGNAQTNPVNITTSVSKQKIYEELREFYSLLDSAAQSIQWKNTIFINYSRSNLKMANEGEKEILGCDISVKYINKIIISKTNKKQIRYRTQKFIRKIFIYSL